MHNVFRWPSVISHALHHRVTFGVELASPGGHRYHWPVARFLGHLQVWPSRVGRQVWESKAAFFAANSSSVRIPWSLRAANCAICSGIDAVTPAG